jgi:AmmeMemoRadiSam system protein A
LAVSGGALPEINLESVSSALREEAACFVTLEIDGQLRGCIGGLEAVRPLAEEIIRTAAQAALNDPRFPPVTPAEVPLLEIEISVLTAPRPLEYDGPNDLLQKIRPGVHGVTLKADALHRATFLPQVWEKIPDPEQFLGMLCRKMGLPMDTWRKKRLDVETYQAIAWEEADFE